MLKNLIAEGRELLERNLLNRVKRDKWSAGEKNKKGAQTSDLMADKAALLKKRAERDAEESDPGKPTTKSYVSGSTQLHPRGSK